MKYLETGANRSWKVHHYLATDPSEGFLTRLASKNLSSVECKLGTGECIVGIEDNSVDVIIAAQAFHWMANQNTLNEVYRVLRSGGAFIMIYNIYIYGTASWLIELEEKLLSKLYPPEIPRQQTGKWRECFTWEQTQSQFTSLQEWSVGYDQMGPGEMIIHRMMSASVIAEKTTTEQASIQQQIECILDHHPSLEESRQTGQYVIPYNTIVAWVYKR